MNKIIIGIVIICIIIGSALYFERPNLFKGGIGTQGEIGTQGIQGIQGEIGYNGSQGIQGEIGYNGSQGIQGINAAYYQLYAYMILPANEAGYIQVQNGSSGQIIEALSSTNFSMVAQSTMDIMFNGGVLFIKGFHNQTGTGLVPRNGTTISGEGAYLSSITGLFGGTQILAINKMDRMFDLRNSGSIKIENIRILGDGLATVLIDAGHNSDYPSGNSIIRDTWLSGGIVADINATFVADFSLNHVRMMGKAQNGTNVTQFGLYSLNMGGGITIDGNSLFSKDFVYAMSIYGDLGLIRISDSTIENTVFFNGTDIMQFDLTNVWMEDLGANKQLINIAGSILVNIDGGRFYTTSTSKPIFKGFATATLSIKGAWAHASGAGTNKEVAGAFAYVSLIDVDLAHGLDTSALTAYYWKNMAGFVQSNLDFTISFINQVSPLVLQYGVTTPSVPTFVGTSIASANYARVTDATTTNCTLTSSSGNLSGSVHVIIGVGAP